MKRFLALVLAIILCLSMVGCGKSEAVKAAEAAITALASAEDMAAALTLAQEAYDAVPAEEQAKVKNAADLTAAWNTFLADEWVLEFSHIEENSGVLNLNADGTMMFGNGAEQYSGNWALEGDTVAINFDIGLNGKSKLYQEDGFYKISLSGLLGEALVRKSDFDAAFAKKFVAVEITPENFDEYIGQPVKMDYDVVDEWGDVQSDRTVWIYPSNAYDDGLVYYDHSDDFAFEVTSKYSWGSDTGTVTDPYFVNDYYEDHRGLENAGTRAKGTIYYIKAEYVEDVYLDGTTRYLKLKDGTSHHTRGYGFSELSDPEAALKDYMY